MKCSRCGNYANIFFKLFTLGPDLFKGITEIWVCRECFIKELEGDDLTIHRSLK